MDANFFQILGQTGVEIILRDDNVPVMSSSTIFYVCVDVGEAMILFETLS